MAHLVSLDKTTHRHIRIDSRRVEASGAKLNMVPVVMTEFLKLVVQYPIAFAKDKETGRFTCVALFGFHDEENLFVENAEWNAIYVPLQGPSELGASGKLLHWDRGADLTRINVPALVIGAQHDTMDPDHLRAMAGRFTDGAYHHCPAGSHLALVDDQETYFEGLVSFLHEVDSRG